MIISKFSLSAFFLFVICTCFAQNPDDHTPLPRHGLLTNQQLRMSSMMLEYVRSKGCDYVMAFVKGHYYKHGHGDDDHGHNRDDAVKTCDWKPWMENRCAQYHVPMELCCALMDCGASRSMVALGAPSNMIDKCNMTDAVHAIHGHGKRSGNGRHGDPPSTSHMCPSFPEAVIFGKRILDSDVHVLSNLTRVSQHGHSTNGISINTTSFGNASEKPYSRLSVMNSKPYSRLSVMNSKPYSRLSVMNSTQPRLIRRWCKIFSRSVNKKYHLNEIKFIRRSVYWLVDIYKAARQHHVPKHYTHGLVGCGETEYEYSQFQGGNITKLMCGNDNARVENGNFYVENDNPSVEKGSLNKENSNFSEENDILNLEM